MPTLQTSAPRPLTRQQRQAIMFHFRRLDLLATSWRAYRLEVAASLGCRRRIYSVNDLTQGEAGRLIGALSRCRDCRDLAVLLAAEITDIYDAHPDAFNDPND